MRVLTACYDLEFSPPTYDFVGFLVAAEQERIDQDFDALDIAIIPGSNYGFRVDNLPPRRIEDRIAMRDEIVVPMARLLPSVRNVIVQPVRGVPAGETTCYGGARYGTDVMVRMWENNCFPLRGPEVPILENWNDDIVTITLREAPYHPTRNSNLAEWMAVADWLQRQGYTVLIVRDTSNADQPLPHSIVPAVSWDLTRRAKLYANAKLNLFVNNGPAWMCVFMGAPAFICKMTAPDAPCVDPAFFAGVGLPVGSQIPNARPMQRILWENDTAANIIPAVREMLA